MECKRSYCVNWYEGINEDDCLDCVDGRYLEEVAEYASTCDRCGELCGHVDLAMDPKTQLGYCPNCVEEMGLPEKHHPNSTWA